MNLGGMSVLCDRIKAMRQAKGMKQEELGAQLGVTKQTVSNWESGNIMPSLDMFWKLVRYFKTTPNFLLGYDECNNIDISGLTDGEAAHIQLIVSNLQALHKITNQEE